MEWIWTEHEVAERAKLPAYESWGQFDEWFLMNVRAIYRFKKGRVDDKALREKARPPS